MAGLAQPDEAVITVYKEIKLTKRSKIIPLQSVPNISQSFIGGMNVQLPRSVILIILKWNVKTATKTSFQPTLTKKTVNMQVVAVTTKTVIIPLSNIDQVTCYILLNFSEVEYCALPQLRFLFSLRFRLKFRFPFWFRFKFRLIF